MRRLTRAGRRSQPRSRRHGHPLAHGHEATLTAERKETMNEMTTQKLEANKAVVGTGRLSESKDDCLKGSTGHDWGTLATNATEPLRYCRHCYSRPGFPD